jgi:beta-N-acetylhexosaminidase
MSVPSAAIYGWRQPGLDPETAAFFRDANPWGFILFEGACVSRLQVRRLVESLWQTVDREALVFIDQEGGRVARLKPPEWPLFPAAASYGDLYRLDREAGLEACRLGHRLMAHELAPLGIRADCAPVLDLPAEGADPIIGDRAFGADPDQIAALGRAALAGLTDGGVAGVIKHVPGHGRADADSHLALPKVRAGRQALAQDFACFARLADAPMAMTAHVLYDAYDPTAPATISSLVVDKVIRGEIGFQGLLMTDDLGMKALAGTWAEKALASFAAGCDVALHCSGILAEMRELAAAIPTLAGAALERVRAADAAAAVTPRPFDSFEGRARLDELLARVPARVPSAPPLA